MDFYDFGKTLINKNSVEPLAIITLSTSAAMLVDRKEWQNTKIITRRSHILPQLTKSIVNIGDGRWLLSAAGLGILSGLLIHNERVVNTSFESIEAIISTGLFVQTAKRITGRQSPAAAGRSSDIWEVFVDPIEYQHDQPNFYSFPSGHLAGATAILTVITENYPEVKWLKPLSYVVLGVLAFSLVANDMHWYSDFPVALGTGYLFGKMISERYVYNSSKTFEKDRISFQPFIMHGGMGVEFSCSL
jgi:membrane-associated phospholipid phosphatase